LGDALGDAAGDAPSKRSASFKMTNITGLATLSCVVIVNISVPNQEN
jgi:hypothetical protein